MSTVGHRTKRVGFGQGWGSWKYFAGRTNGMDVLSVGSGRKKSILVTSDFMVGLTGDFNRGAIGLDGKDGIVRFATTNKDFESY